ncbi:M15 family metallopeptidase [Streptomyces klenkii]|uniref:M15 family metallopeptidase n=1 Tax=Streptomyces klenkii TaxID=1420899 RepID=UPI0034433092
MPEIILMCDPAVAAIPIQECDERLVDVRGSDLLVGHSRQDAAGAYAHVRANIFERLLMAQAALPKGLRLLLVEGYRPPELQERYFAEYAAELQAANPSWSIDQVHMAASRYVSPPSIAPHAAGAAVDVTLIDTDGRELDLGTRVNASPEESDGACYMDADNISGGAREHRRVLASALAEAGFVNYPTEWWHWSRGDRYWALSTASATAPYGPCSLPLP